jgi:hypothetical protein
LCHGLLGGLTNGSWWCGVSGAPSHEPPSFPPEPGRCLYHILDPLLPGRRASPPPLPMRPLNRVVWEGGYLLPGGLLPCSKVSAPCLCPAVKAKGWVIRPLERKELLSCMDVPLNAQSSAPLAVDELMATGPGKILYAWGHYVVQQKAYSCATPFFGSNEDIGNSNIARLEAKPEEPTETKADPALIHNNVTSEVWEVDEPVMSARQRAAKDDNATVPFAIWDVPFWEYLMSLGHSQKFLRSRQVIQVKGRQVDLLSCLRDWLLRAWRRSIFLSFSRFM